MPKPFTLEDLYLYRHIKSAHAVPGLDRAVCEVRAINRDGDTYDTHLWQFPLDGSAGSMLPFTDGNDASPRWSPQGDRLAFLSTRGGSKQVYVADRDGDRAEVVGNLPTGVSNYRWQPDGSGFIVTSGVAVDPDRHGKPDDRPPPPRKNGAPEVAWRLPYKEDGIGYILARQFHLFSLDAATGEHRQLSSGAFDVVGFDVSPDGTQVAYTRTREGRYAHNYDLWVLDLASGRHTRITTRLAMVMQPTWAPDGKRIAFSGAVEEGDAEPRLWLVDVASKAVEEIGGDAIDVADPESLHWSKDGRSLVFLRAYCGRHQVVSLPVDGGEPTVLVGGDLQIGAFACTDRHLVYANQDPVRAEELRLCPIEGGEETILSDFNGWWLDRPRIRCEGRRFDVPDGKGGRETIEGWLIEADDGVTGPKPLLDDAHGGPAAYALLDFGSNVFWQVLCSRGWRVLALNSVGSASYGREFCQRLAGHWGEHDLPQHLEALQQLQREGLCDDRIAVSGKSYGGFYASWATGHTDLYKAAVVMAPVGNIETHYGTSDGGYYADPLYIASKPRFDRQVARRLSPLQSIEKSKTPTLFLQGKEDERCPKCQSEELFVSLYRAGDTPAELVLYPGEGHSFLGSGAPSCREDAAGRILRWLEQHAAPPQPVRAAAPAEQEEEPVS